MMKITVKLPDGQVEQTVNKSTAVVGRSNKCDVVVPVESLSRQHCQIELSDGQFFITDLGSANGVFLDGKKIPAQERIPFETFLQLTLGPLECQVQDSSDASAVRPIPSSFYEDSSSSSSSSNTVTKKLSTSSILRTTPPPPPKSSKKEKDPAQIGVVISALAFVGILGYLGFTIVTEEEAPASDPVQAVAQRPAASAPKEAREVNPDNISNSFLTSSEYLELFKTKSCQGELEKICRDMKLNPAEGEGAVNVKEEYFIFTAPQEEAQESTFAGIKGKSNDLALVALNSLVRSDLFFQMVQKKVGQIHVVLLGPSKNPLKVMKLHVKGFSKISDRMDILKDLITALKTGDTDTLWNKYKTRITFKDLA